MIVDEIELTPVFVNVTERLLSIGFLIVRPCSFLNSFQKLVLHTF